MARYRTAFYAPLVSDWQNFGQWTESGSKTATERAHTLWQHSLDHYVPPVRDPAISAALDDFVARRTAAGGAPPVS
jgi:trimethylamine--corrinoid protein Co-methyltransferase